MMFEQWWKDNELACCIMPYSHDVAKHAWEAATKAERERCAVVAENAAKEATKEVMAEVEILARTDEREACAKICENRANSSVGKGRSSAEWCVSAIRSRSNA